MKRKFKKGDIVKRISGHDFPKLGMISGKTYKVIGYTILDGLIVKTKKGNKNFNENNFILANSNMIKNRLGIW